MNDLEILTLEAFLAALAKQSASLPHEIQKRLHSIGENLEQHVDELDALAETYPPLDSAYQSERLALQRQGGQRQKLLNAPKGSSTDSLPRIAKAIFRSDNSVLTTQDFFRLAIDHPELVLTSSKGSSDHEVSKTAPTIPTIATSPTNASASSPLAQSASHGIQRIVLAANASDRDRQNYQKYLEELKRLNPDWTLVPDRPQPDESDAYLIMHQNENYAARHAAYIATRYLNDFCQNLKL